MALSEQQIDALVESILHGTQEKYVQDMTDLMLEHFQQGFSRLGDMAALQKLAETFPGQAQSILAKYQDVISDEVRQEIENALNESSAADLKQLNNIYGQERSSVAQAYFSMGATAHFAALAKATADQIADVVRRQNILMNQQAEKKWYQVSQDAINSVVLGTKPTEKALADGVVELMDAGITTIDYGYNGLHTVSNMIDVALRRHIVSQVSQVGGQMSLEAMQSYGHDFAITSAHFGARPSHAKWQGLPGCLSGVKTVDGTTYPDFYELTGYMGLRGPNVSLGDRLKGVNCRHSLHPFFPGITQLPDREFKEAQKKYGKSNEEHYADLQRQRELERRIRKTKREIAGLEKAGLGLENPTYVQKRLVLGNQQRMLRNHCEANKLVRLYNREKAYGVASQPRALITKRSFNYARVKISQNALLSDLNSFAGQYRGAEVEYGMAFDKDWNNLFDQAIKGEKHFVSIPLPEGHKNWHSLRVAHTHTQDYGGTFSLTDVVDFNRNRPISTSVIANEGNYMLEQIGGKRHAWVNLTKAYESYYAERYNFHYDTLENQCLRRGLPSTDREREIARNNIAKDMHDWFKKHAKHYGFKYILDSI